MLRALVRYDGAISLRVIASASGGIEMEFRVRVFLLFVGFAFQAACVVAQLPNHPILTEVYTDPPGVNDAPFGRDATNLHQEYIEIYLPPAASLAAGLNKDALRLAIYEVEGDSSSSGLGLINYRFDLPSFDLDPANGLTAGAIARPSSGVVVLGWVDYTSTTPVVLFGTPSTRRATINGGITATDGTYAFIAINGAQGTGTTNFPVPSAENRIDMPSEASSGIIQNGSGAYLLVNRDSSGYVMLCDDAHAAECPAGSDPNLPNNAAGLNTPALLDGFAGNDSGQFVVTEQPYATPTGNDIDLETVLPLGGAFSLLVAQVPENDTSREFAGVANGFARRFIDIPKTTETGAADDPVADATLAYRHIRNDGPFLPNPGRAILTTSPAELGLAKSIEHSVQVIAGTTGRPGLLAANAGGNFAINLSTSAGASSNASIATFAAGTPVNGVPGQTLAFPTVGVTANAGAAHNSAASSLITVTATNAVGGSPAVISPVQSTTLTATVLKPTTGMNAAGQPFQATVFAAIQGIAAGAAQNEFLGTSLGAYVDANLGVFVQDTLSNGGVLTDPATDINNGPFMQAIIREFPDPGTGINPAGPPGRLNLVQTVLQSAEVQSGSGTYDSAFSGGNTAIRAVRFNCPDTFTFDGAFSPSELVQFVDATGRAGSIRSGLANATATRTFELAIFDTNVQDPGTLETGATDDFGIVIEVETTEAGSPVVPGEFVFLSFTGGFQGADIDGLQVPPGNNIANVVYLDLDNLHTVLGIRTVEAIYLIDAGSDAEPDIAEVFSLNPSTLPASITSASPTNGASVWRSSQNVVRITFSANIVAPAPGQLLIQQMLPNGAFGADLSGGFTMTVENDGLNNPRILKIVDSEPVHLLHRNWYSIRNAGVWPSVADFEVQYVVQVGDADGDRQVLNLDAGLINAAVPSFGVPDTDRRNIDTDTAILNADVSAANARIPSFLVAKPSGH